MTDPVIITAHPGWTEICLNRPDRLNAFNDDMHAQLANSMKTAAEDASVRCVLLTGSGRGFCAGQDLKEVTDPELNPGFKKILEEHYNPIITRLRSVKKPIIGAINGVAAGAGANIALACDIVVAHNKVSFIQAFSSVSYTHLRAPRDGLLSRMPSSA